MRECIKKHPRFFDGVADVPLHEHKPLRIEAGSDQDHVLKSYKAPWDQQEATDSLRTTSRYEAAGNIAWLRLFPLSEDMETVAGAGEGRGMGGGGGWSEC